MRQLRPYSLWLGHVGDTWDLKSVLAEGISALVDLAAMEKPPTITRDLIYCRFPMVDGIGNPPWLLRLAVETVANLLRSEISTLVFCSAGMSRTPTIAAAALSVLSGQQVVDCLKLVTGSACADVSPGLLGEVQALYP